MSSTRVFIIGCGIAGPVLAILLKQKGYKPVLFDRLDGVTEAGISLALQPNGLKVLNLIPDLIPHIPGHHIDRMTSYSIAGNEILSDNEVGGALKEKYGFGMIGVQRTAFHKLLTETATKHGIPIHWGHQLSSLEQTDSDVTATFKSGFTDTASIVIGCDGLHSQTRISLFGPENPTFTGLIQTGGISITPATLATNSALCNVYGINAHMIHYPISETNSSWAITSAESEAKETWRHIDDQQKEEFKSGPFSYWQFDAGTIIKDSQKIVKYGLYDRPELMTWYKGRVVLLGDAAHPTTPHIGQGANQAFEDVYHLVRCFVKYNSHPSVSISTETLRTIFSEYESIRLNRSAILVKEAMRQGDIRVVPNEEAGKKRDEFIKKHLTKEAFLEGYQGYQFTAKGPFEGQSEI